jgi:hypothetical protein
MVNPFEPMLTLFFCDRASGSVYVAKTLATGARVAIKQMDLAQQPRKELIVNEIIIMNESRHPNVVNFLEAFLIRSSDLWVVMEYMEGGALYDVIETNKLEEEQIAAICLGVSGMRRLIADRANFSCLDLPRFEASARSSDHSS